jgi:peptidoglycan hydrolase-like protein with peptidoglycan-binding domain
MLTRRLAVLGVAAAMVATSVGGLVAGTRLRSPEQAAADARPPEATLLTARVVKRQLVKEVVLRGDVKASAQTDVVAQVGDGPTIVTDLPLAQDVKVAEGAVVAVVNGRPVLALGGPLPAYRDLRPGDTGPDVAQLQAALNRLGYRVASDRKATFGPATEVAMRRLYERAGFDPAATSEDVAGVERHAASQVLAATDAVESAQRAYDRAARPPATDSASTRRAVQRASTELDLARRRAKRSRDDAAAAVATAIRALDAARQDNQHTTRVADARAAAEDAQRNQAIVRLAQADALESARAAVTVAEQELGALAPTASLIELTRARQRVESSQRALRLAEFTAQDAQQDADNAVAQAAGTLVAALNDQSHDARVQEATDFVAAAHRAEELAAVEASHMVDQAVQALEDAQAVTTPADGSTLADLRMGLAAARRALRDTRADAAAVIATAGTTLPRAEVVFVPTLPASVVAVHANVGRPVPDNGVLLAMGSGATTVLARASQADQSLLRPGLPAVIHDELHARTYSAVVSSIAERPEEDDGGGYAVGIAPSEAVPDDALGGNVRVTVASASTATEVLAVPSAAVLADATGDTHLELVKAGKRHRVPVVPGLVANGIVEVRPVSRDRLKPGDEVVLGSASSTAARR